MGLHVRKQIRDAAATTLTGLTETGANVFKSRLYNLQPTELPALKIDTKDEQTAISSMGSNRIIERTLELDVMVCVKQVSGYNTEIDEICREVEVALANDNTLGGLCKYIGPPAFSLQFDEQSDVAAAVGTMKFPVVYYTAYNAPDVAL